jgi:hypothetical protein
MMLYLLDHRHWIDDEYYDTKFIGIFSSRTLVSKTIDKYNDLPGFCNFTSGFHIESIVISQKAKHIDSKKVYILTTTQILDDDEITVSYCVYLSFFSAKLAQIMKAIVSYWKKKRKYYVSKHCINQPEWTEGFNIIC